MKKLLVLTVAMALVGAQAGYSATATTPTKHAPVAVVKPAVAAKPAPVAVKAEVKPAVAVKPAAVEVKKAEAPVASTEPKKAEKCCCKFCKEDKPCFFCRLFKKCK